MDNNQSQNGMSAYKIVGIIALVCSVVSLFFGGLAAQLVAIVLSIIVLASKKPMEKEARTFALVALIIAAVLFVVTLITVIPFLLQYGDVLTSSGSVTSW